MKKDKSHGKGHHPAEASKRQRWQHQYLQVRRRRNITALLGLGMLAGMAAGEYFASVPPWLWVVLMVFPVLLLLDVAYLRYLQRQLGSHH